MAIIDEGIAALRMLVILLPLVVSAAAAAQPPAAVPVERLADVPNVQISSYEVSGETEGAIRASINARRPRDPVSGERVDAHVRWTMTWGWPLDGRGGCDLSRASIQFSATVTMPRLTNEERLPPELRAGWRAFIVGLDRHLAGHLAFPYEHRSEVLDAIRASNCTRASAAAQAAMQRLSRNDADYDRRTRRGETQGAVFPLIRRD